MTNRWATRTRRAYLAWLAAREPRVASTPGTSSACGRRSSGPFDYENENTTRSLWIAEGFTDYYADLQVERAGLQTRDEYLEDLSSTIELLQTTPGRLGAVRRDGIVRRVDQVLPARRELEQHVDQLLHQGHGHRVPARREDPQGDQRRASRSTT